MRKTLFILFFFFSYSSFAKIIYVDKQDAVYQYSVGFKQNFDINSDGQDDIVLMFNSLSSQFNCGNSSCANISYVRINGLSNSYGKNYINSNGTAPLDCTNDTLNLSDKWNDLSIMYDGCIIDECIGNKSGKHKLGFRLIKINPGTNTLGFIYGYINYTLTNNLDVVIHGFYYEDNFNTPIVANSQLEYPYDENCIHYDTIKVPVNDTIHVIINDTNKIVSYDTLIVNDTNHIVINDTNKINVVDTSYVTITDTSHVVFNDTNMVNIIDTSYVVVNDTNNINIIDTSYVTITDTNKVNIIDTSYVTITDTSHVIVNDTNLVTINDTVLIAVTDTLIIDVTLAGINSLKDLNTIKIYPNPATDIVIIDNGNFAKMNNYSIKIMNTLGQSVFNSQITIPQFQIPISTFGATGTYFVQIVDPNNKVIDTRKLILK